MNADYVIVGAGSAGCAMAYRLAEAGRRVIVIEHGGSEVDATKETRWRRVIESMGITEAWLEGKP